MIYDAGRSRWVRGGPIATEDLLHFSSFNGRIWGIDYQGHRYPLERQILYFKTLMWLWGFTNQGPVQQGLAWSSWSVDDQPYQPALSGTTLIVADAVGPVTALDSGDGTDPLGDRRGRGHHGPSNHRRDPLRWWAMSTGRLTALSIADGSTAWETQLDAPITASRYRGRRHGAGPNCGQRRNPLRFGGEPRVSELINQST